MGEAVSAIGVSWGTGVVTVDESVVSGVCAAGIVIIDVGVVVADVWSVVVGGVGTKSDAIKGEDAGVAAEVAEL